MDMNAPPPPSTPKRARASATPADYQEAKHGEAMERHPPFGDLVKVVVPI